MAYLRKEDQAKAAARHYQANKDKMKARALAHTKRVKGEIRDMIRLLKGTTPCGDCGVQYPFYIMQFDHVRGTKKFNLGEARYWTSLARVQDEIAKCEIVCANCHAGRTYARLAGTERVGEASISLGS